MTIATHTGRDKYMAIYTIQHETLVVENLGRLAVLHSKIARIKIIGIYNFGRSVANR